MMVEVVVDPGGDGGDGGGSGGDPGGGGGDMEVVVVTGGGVRSFAELFLVGLVEMLLFYHQPLLGSMFFCISLLSHLIVFILLLNR